MTQREFGKAIVDLETMYNLPTPVPFGFYTWLYEMCKHLTVEEFIKQHEDAIKKVYCEHNK